ncbi:hypothetical protein [Portibacter marinus]|uniref:hypothetical protein n=1 Tax=Portibacter marinus TaxID=2898660 RepID=UPI001F2E242C|nr:hypothetical protein [Portibacter marinus]
MQLIVKSLLKVFCLTVVIGPHTSCKNSRINRLEGKEGRYMAKIVTSAGDHIDKLNNDTLDYLVFPFNVAEFSGNRNQKKTVFIIGKSINTGQNVSFLPLATLTYNNGEERKVIVARPTNPQLVTAQIENYYDLISVHYGVQKLIETWITYSKGFGSLKYMEWNNEDSAINFLGT